jgi:hypothetical protein
MICMIIPDAIARRFDPNRPSFCDSSALAGRGIVRIGAILDGFTGESKKQAQHRSVFTKTQF